MSDVGEHAAIISVGTVGALGFVVLTCFGHPSEGAALLTFIGGLLIYIVGRQKGVT
mgnify:CR=1 FL=1